MSTPHIVIQQHDSGLYEWLALYHQEKIDSEVGDTSITGCLISAVGAIPETEKLVEITYQGIHMGTFHKGQIEKYTEGVSKRIVAEHTHLIQYLP